jgi:hypothetical protein
VPRTTIRNYVQKIVERFHPLRVILFGSHAYGKPDEEVTWICWSSCPAGA